MGDTTIEVIVIDDHRVVGLGVTAAFENRGVDASISWAPTVRDAKRLRGQVAILDLRLADGSDPDRNIADLNGRAIPVVVYTSGDDPYLVRRAIAGGALSIIRKSAPPRRPRRSRPRRRRRRHLPHPRLGRRARRRRRFRRRPPV